MNTKIAYQTGLGGWYFGPVDAYESPEEPGVFHIPGGAVEIAPPQTWPEGSWPLWDGVAWQITKIPAEDPERVSVLARLSTWLKSLLS